MKTKTRDNRGESETQREKDALFTAWSEDRQSAHPQPLRAWIARYPQHTNALIGWAADMPLVECAQAKYVPDPIGEARTLAIGRMALAEMRAQYFTVEVETIKSEAVKQNLVNQESSPRISALGDLIQAAKAQGLNGKALAGQLSIGLPLLAKLNQRLIHLSTLPEELIERLAATLQTSSEQVRDYLARPATLSAAAQYKSDGIPQVAAAEDFMAAVRACSDMTDEQKQYWLRQQDQP